MNLGLFYQSGYRIEACYHALNQFRKFYPDAPIALYEDNSDILLPVAKKFNCVYDKTKVQGINYANNGRASFDINSTLGWLDRVYEACVTTLKNVDWVLHFEDDVWIKRKIYGTPPYDLSGIAGRGWNIELYKYLESNVHANFGCGGAVFNRLKYIEAYENSKNIDWNYIDYLAIDPKPSEWADSALTLIFLYSKFTIGSWSELHQYRNENVITLMDRRGWPGKIEELEKTQPDTAVIHCWKPYYYPTEEEIKYVNNQLK